MPKKGLNTQGRGGGWGVGSLENMSKIKEQERGKENKIRQK